MQPGQDWFTDTSAIKLPTVSWHDSGIPAASQWSFNMQTIWNSHCRILSMYVAGAKSHHCMSGVAALKTLGLLEHQWQSPQRHICHHVHCPAITASLHHGIMSVSFHSICFFVRVKGCDEPSLRFSHDSRLEDCRDLRAAWLLFLSPLFVASATGLVIMLRPVCSWGAVASTWIHTWLHRNPFFLLLTLRFFRWF